MGHGATCPHAPSARAGETETFSDRSTEFQSLQTPTSVQFPTTSEITEPSDVVEQPQWASEDGISMMRRLQLQVARSNNGVDNFRQPRGQILSTAKLLALSFFAVSSGPEVYFFPMAFMVTELVSAIPEAGGHAYWVALAFGPGWGLQAGFWAWVGNCMHCAAYASMGVGAIYRVAGWENMPVLEYSMRAGVSMLLALPSFFHLRIVSYAAGSLIVFILIPFALVAVWSAVIAESWEKLSVIPDNAMKAENQQLGYGNLVTALVWNFNGFQNISVFAKCVVDPARTFRRVMLISFVLIPLSYLAPVVPVIALCEPDWTTWIGSGSAIYSASKAVYRWPHLQCLLACGMVEKDFAPFSLRLSGMARPNVHGIDHSVIFCSLAITLIVATITIKDMVAISNALSGLETMVLIAAAVRLRATMPDLLRSTYLCGSSHPWIMATALVAPFVASGFVVGWAFTDLIPGALASVFLFSGIIYSIQSDLKDFRHTYEPVRTTENT